MSVTVNRTAQRYSSGAQAKPRMVLLHTTEGMGWPGYGGGSSAPHATIRPIPGEGIEVREHIPFTQFAKALQNRAGGVQTNTSGVLQFELMGTCDERTASRAYYWPRADDAVLRALADYLRPIMATYGIPHTSDVTWKSYNRGQVPSSYGLSNGVRMSFAKWGTFRGICGHQHAPENDHGDPGDFPIATLLRHLSGKATTPKAPSAKPASKPKPATTSKAPTFPLPRGSYFGPKSGPAASVSGYYSHRADLKRWQAQMRKRGWSLTADGLYGPRTATVARQFQKQAGLARDGLIGASTWAAAWTEPVV